METLLSLIFLFLSWVPVMILLVSGIHHRNAHVLWRKYGIVSIVAFALLWLYSAAAFPDLGQLVLWGVIAGIALTIALDVVRLTGVALGTMPMDMPMSFGLRLTGLMKEVEMKMMAKRKEKLAQPKPAGAGGPKMEMPHELSMFEAAKMMEPVVMEVLMEKRAKGRVMSWGYVWHFLNGIAFGLTYVLVFGAGHWTVALGWALTVWALMMLMMPGLMMGAQVPKSTFFTALVAHIAMALPLFALPIFLSPETSESTLLHLIASLVGLL